MELIDHLSEKGQYDFNLVQRALREKDQKAYAELMQRYREPIYFMLLKMVNNKDDADDLTIEAFGKAFKRLEQYTPQFAFSTCSSRLRPTTVSILSVKKEFAQYLSTRVLQLTMAKRLK